MTARPDLLGRVRLAWSYTFPILQKHRFAIIAGLGCACLNRLSQLMGPVCVRFIIDTIIGRHQFERLWLAVVFMLCAALVEAASGRACVHFLSSAVERVVASLRSRVQAHLLRLPVSFFDKARSGELVSRVIHDANGIESIVGTNISIGVSELLYVAAALAYLAYLNLELLGIGVSFLALAVTPYLFGGKRMASLFQSRRNLVGQLTASITDLIGGIRTIKIYRAEIPESERFERGTFEVAESGIRAKRVGSSIDSASTLAFGAMAGLIFYVGGRQVEHGILSLGQFTAFTMILWSVMWPLLNLVNLATQAIDGFSGLERVIELLGEPTEMTEKESKFKPLEADLSGTIDVDNVSYSYAKTEYALRKVSFRAAPGTITAFVGPSGAGKSTMMAILAGLYSPTSGLVRIDGVELSRIGLAKYRKQVAFVQQNTFLFPGTIRENILLANPSATDDELERASWLAGVHRFSDTLAAKMDTPVGERGVRLSGGQQQRISIARAFLANPLILLLDEPSANLDLESEMMINEALSQLMSCRTTIMVAHRLSTIRRADQILVFDQGQIVEFGTHHSLKAGNGRYRKFYEQEALSLNDLSLPAAAD